MVNTGSNNIYDLYMTVATSGSYAWQNVGTTDVTLPIVDNLTTEDANQALSAKQGVVLDGKISQLGQELSSDVDSLKQQTIELSADVTEIDEAVNGGSSEITTQYSLPGFISIADGIIAGTGGTWIHSDLIPVESFVKAGKFVSHSSVASVAYYTGNEISSANYISGQHFGREREVTKADLTIPANAAYIVFTTDGASRQLYVITEVETPGLQEKVATLEEVSTDLDTRVTTLENKVNRSTKNLHFSFDDTISALYDIAHNNRTSIFENAFFGALKTLHETYGAVFSCYCFLDYIIAKYVSKISTIENPDTSAVYYLSTQDGEFAPGEYVYKNGSWVAFENVTRSDYVIFSLSSFPNTYAAEFAANSKWLKFGFHSKDGLTNYSGATAEDAESDYNSFINSILAITGTPECVDTVVRLQNFSGSLNACRAMRDANLGVQGFLCADYSETGGGSGGQNIGYYLTSPAPAIIWKKGQYYDYVERLHFYMSALRMDSITSANMPAYMAQFLTAYRWEQTAMVEMFCHENQMYRVSDNTITSDYIARIQAVCSWAVAKKFNFAYQMDKIRQSF